MPAIPKTRTITTTATVSLTEDEVIAFIIAGVKRDHPDLREFDMTVVFEGSGETMAVVDARKITGGEA